MGFPASHPPRFYAAPNFLKMGINYLNCRLLDNFDNKGREVCCKVSLYNNCQRQRCSAINCLWSGINILAWGSSIPLISERKGTHPHWKHLRCTHFASQRGILDAIASLACVRLTGWPAWNWRHAVLSADAGLLVSICTVFTLCCLCDLAY